MYPKVLVGCPIASVKAYCLDEYAEGVKNLSYPNYDILLVDNSKDETFIEQLKQRGLPAVRYPCIPGVRKRVAESRNVLREKALKEGYDYFFCLESDVIPPRNIIERLLAHKKKVITAVFTKLYTITKDNKPIGKQELPILYVMTRENHVRRMTMNDVATGKLLQVGGGGVGCILIHRDVLEKITFRVEEHKKAFDDMFFFQDIWKLRIPAFCDTTIVCKHLEKEWPKEILDS